MSSALVAAIASIDPSSSRWTGPTLTMMPMSGSAISASSAIWPAAAHRHLQDEDLGAARRAEDLQREPDLGVEVRAARHGAPVGRQDRVEEVLGRGLAGRAGDADDVGLQVAAPLGGQRLEGLQGVGRRQDRLGRVLGVGGRGVLLGREDAPGAGVERLRGESSAVVVGAFQADEQCAGSGGARVNDDRLRAVFGRRRGDQLRACRPSYVFRAPLLHPPGEYPSIRRSDGLRRFVPLRVARSRAGQTGDHVDLGRARGSRASGCHRR